jgi:hypothetical protein
MDRSLKRDHWKAHYKITKEIRVLVTTVMGNALSWLLVWDKCKGRVNELCETHLSMLTISVTRKKTNVRKCYEYYIKLRYPWTVGELEQIHICEILYESVKNGSMKPSNLEQNSDIMANQKNYSKIYWRISNSWRKQYAVWSKVEKCRNWKSLIVYCT